MKLVLDINSTHVFLVLHYLELVGISNGPIICHQVENVTLVSRVVKTDVTYHFCIGCHVGISLDVLFLVLVLTHKLTLSK